MLQQSVDGLKVRSCGEIVLIKLTTVCRENACGRILYSGEQIVELEDQVERFKVSSLGRPS